MCVAPAGPLEFGQYGEPFNPRSDSAFSVGAQRLGSWRGSRFHNFGEHSRRTGGFAHAVHRRLAAGSQHSLAAPPIRSQPALRSKRFRDTSSGMDGNVSCDVPPFGTFQEYVVQVVQFLVSAVVCQGPVRTRRLWAESPLMHQLQQGFAGDARGKSRRCRPKRTRCAT